MAASVLVTWIDLRDGREFDTTEHYRKGESGRQLETRLREMRGGFDFPVRLDTIWDDQTVAEARAGRKHVRYVGH